jgi:hypothetical protein
MTDWSRSVIDTAVDIHGDVSGSGDPLPDFYEALDWLTTRVESGWEPSVIRDSEEYDNAVRELGRTAVREARRKIARQTNNG